MNDDELSALIRGRATRHKASERLRAGVRTQVALLTAARAGAAQPAPAKRAARFAWRGPATGFAFGIALTLALGWIVPHLNAPDALPAELVADHVRALKFGPLIEVASSDRHTVKPWFQGKLDYAPQVVDLEADGFALLGARARPVAGAPRAALAYALRRHILSVFVWPAERQQAPAVTQHNGFNLLHWSDGAMQVWVVSDVEVNDLERFGQAWRARVEARR